MDLENKRIESLEIVDDMIEELYNKEFPENVGLESQACVKKLQLFYKKIDKANNSFSINFVLAKAKFYYNSIIKYSK